MAPAESWLPSTWTRDPGSRWSHRGHGLHVHFLCSSHPAAELLRTEGRREQVAMNPCLVGAPVCKAVPTRWWSGRGLAP